jgi:hypothetical protein
VELVDDLVSKCKELDRALIDVESLKAEQSTTRRRGCVVAVAVGVKAHDHDYDHDYGDD